MKLDGIAAGPVVEHAAMIAGGEGDRTLQIVAAADELLSEEGLDGLTIRAVLRRTGLSRRAFYERFPGKDELVLAVFEHMIALAAHHYRALVAPVRDPTERLRLIIVSVAMATSAPDQTDSASVNRRGAAMSREHLRLAQSHPDQLEAALSPLLSLIADQLSAGMASGAVREAAPARLAKLIYNLVATTTHAELMAEELVKPDPARRAKMAIEIWEFCRRAVAA